ncbi:tape measure protein [Spirosoma sp. HMF4905]|uniref:Tape measure protein n=1 Tax=Spirosoma arboris TaxID=2682092 RepID=A0A7K1SKP6_9BACT|nr:tape measure protein [Spirosoma arboris]MVM34379.1 tape measure protein [Spirosoma arboris]
MERKLTVEMGFSPTGLESGVGKAISKLQELGSFAIQFGDKFTSAIAGATSSASASISRFATQSNASLTSFYEKQDASRKIFSAGWGRLADDVAKAGKRLTVGLTLPLTLLGGQILQSYAEIDSLNRGLVSVMGSASLAGNEFKALRSVSALPGLGLQEAVAGSVRLQAVGFSADNARKALLQFGNAIALTGGGKSELNSVTVQLGQLAAKGKVLSQDLRPIIEAAPSIAPALLKIFKSVDPEIISEKLKIAGKDSTYFINLLTSELSKLPRIIGGPKNALENLSDSLTIAKYNFGQAADKAIDLTGKINSLGDFITSLSNDFSNLTPQTQGAILVVTSLVAAIGPLTLGLGTVVKLLPTIATGFGALFSPITAVVAVLAAVGVATYSIIKFNLAVVSSYSSARLLSEAHTSLAQSIGAETGRLSALLAVARDEKHSKLDRKKAIADINAISPEYLGNISLETINTKNATQAIREYTKSLTLKSQADYYAAKLSESAAKLTKEKQTPLEDRTTALDGFAARASSIGAYFGYYEESEKKLRKKQSELSSQAISDAQKEYDFNKRNLDVAIEQQVKLTKGKTTPTAIDFVSIGGQSSIAKLKDDVKAAKEAVESFRSDNPNKAVPTELLDRYKILSSRLEDATSDTKKHTAAVKESSSALEILQRVSENTAKKIQDQRALKGFVSAEDVHLLERTDAQIARITGSLEKLDKAQSIKPKVDFFTAEGSEKFRDIAGLVVAPLQRLPGLAARFNDVLKYRTIDQYTESIEKLKSSISKDLFSWLAIPRSTMDSLAEYIALLNKNSRATNEKTGLAEIRADNLAGGTMPNVVAVQSMIDQVRAGKDAINLSVQELAAAMSTGKATLAQGGVELLSGIGSAIGQGQNPLKAALKTILDILGNYIIQLGTALLLSSAALLAAAPLTFGITLAPGLGQQVAGGLLIAGGAAVKAIPFADGGTVEKPTYSLTGEYVGASRNPEFIAPASKAGGIIAQSLVKMGAVGGGGNFSVEKVISGSELRLIIRRSEAADIALGGGLS